MVTPFNFIEDSPIISLINTSAIYIRPEKKTNTNNKTMEKQKDCFFFQTVLHQNILLKWSDFVLIFRERGVRERGTETLISCLSYEPWPETEYATSACVLTGIKLATFVSWENVQPSHTGQGWNEVIFNLYKTDSLNNTQDKLPIWF